MRDNNTKTVLHIANDYSGSTVYMNMVKEIDKLGIRQIIYTPIRHDKLKGKNHVELKTEGSKIMYSHVINDTTDKVLYPIKIRKILIDIQKKIDITEIDIIHAHTWYSDGGVAYELAKKYNKPYLIAIRNTDINVFQKKLFYLRSFGRRILDKAKAVILISASYKDRVFSQKSLKPIIENLTNKTYVIPNGVDSFWIENAAEDKKQRSIGSFNILYVGKFDKGKNVIALQNAIIELKEEIDIPLTLHIIGGGGADEIEVLRNIENYSELFKYHGRIYDKAKLAEIFKICDVFAMPSRAETFGLVYVEAMLQGLPIIYRRNEGIDGFYSEKIGEAVTIGDAEDIKNKLKQIYHNYNSYNLNIPLIKNNHDWKSIAVKYKEIYEI